MRQHSEVDRVARISITALRVVLVLVGLLTVVGAFVDTTDSPLATVMLLLVGVAEIVSGAMLDDRRRWTYWLTLTVVAAGIGADLVWFRPPGLLAYAVFVVILLLPANRQRWFSPRSV